MFFPVLSGYFSQVREAYLDDLYLWSPRYCKEIQSSTGGRDSQMMPSRGGYKILTKGHAEVSVPKIVILDSCTKCTYSDILEILPVGQDVPIGKQRFCNHPDAIQDGVRVFVKAKIPSWCPLEDSD